MFGASSFGFRSLCFFLFMSSFLFWVRFPPEESDSRSRPHGAKKKRQGRTLTKPEEGVQAVSPPPVTSGSALMTSSNAKLSCDKCSYVTNRESKMAEHQSAHAGRWICSVCDKAFRKVDCACAGAGVQKRRFTLGAQNRNAKRSKLQNQN